MAVTDERVLVAADWSVRREKRWSAVARPLGGGGYRVEGPSPGFRFPEEPAIVGFDFPIGFPAAYCERAGLPAFPEALDGWLGRRPEWAAFFAAGNSPSLRQPFYPGCPGGTTQKVLADALGLEPPQWLRACDRLAGAAAMFWTLGPRQVGKAALAGWREVLQVRDRKWKLWPFEGHLDGLDHAVAEVYPALAYGLIGLKRNFGKGTAAGRASQVPAIRGWAERNGVDLPEPLEFPNDDAFDALVGVLGMIACRAEAPGDEAVRRYEGWILGLNGCD